MSTRPLNYRKKPVVIEAMQYDGNNWSEISAWSDGVVDDSCGGGLRIPTLEGEMTAGLGDFIIRGVRGEFYPIRESIFHETYEPVI